MTKVLHVYLRYAVGWGKHRRHGERVEELDLRQGVMWDKDTLGIVL